MNAGAYTKLIQISGMDPVSASSGFLSLPHPPSVQRGVVSCVVPHALKKRILLTVIAMLAGAAVYLFLFLFVDLPIDSYTHGHMKDGVLHTVSVGLANIFEPEWWAILMAVYGAIGLYLDFIKKDSKAARPFVGVAGGLFIALAVAAVAKFGLARYRPEVWFEHQKFGFHFMSGEHDYNSTPSGHTTATFAGLMSIALVVKEKLRRPMVIGAIVIGTIVAASRVIVAAHWPSDVVFGAVLGTIAAYWAQRIVEVWVAWRTS